MAERITLQNTTASEAWEGWVGEQTPEEFLRHYQYSDPAEAAEQYVNDPAFDHNNDEANFTSEEKATIATLLARYIEDAFEGACIMVSRSDSGTYDIPGAAEVENWDDVRADADSVERVSDLAGWGIWNAVYRVEVNGGEAWYFVNEG